MDTSRQSRAAVPQELTPQVWMPVDLHELTIAEIHEELASGFMEVGSTPIPPTPEQLAQEEHRREQELAEQRRTEERERMAQQLADESYRRGFEDGREEGERGELARLQNAVGAAEQALDEVRAGEARWQGQIEENICALAVAIAKQIIQREVETDVEVVHGLVQKALHEFPIDHPVRVRVNPIDLAAIQQVNPDANNDGGLKRGRDTRWLADSSVAPGGCVVEGRDRIVDGRVDTALERVYRRLTHTSA